MVKLSSARSARDSSSMPTPPRGHRLASGLSQRAQKTHGPSTSQILLALVFTMLGGIFVFGSSAYAASDISVSSSGKVSFGKVLASSTGSMVTGEDTLNISTDCEAGANVYATGTNGGNTNLVNRAAEALDSGGTNASTYTISTSASAIGSASTLSNNTWGLNTNTTEASNGLYYGLPAYSSSSLPTVIYSGTNSTVPVYYGAKVTNSLTPGTYSGEVLYTVMVNNSCLDYTVKFNKNADDATGEMADQAILPTGGTLSENSFAYSGYNFLGWSLSADGATGNAVDGIGTQEDVDFADKASFPGSNESILPGSETTLYAIWEVKPPKYMQNWFGCSKLAEGESTTLIDKRDNAEYTVKKFGTGASAECWMTQNLTLGYDRTTNTPTGYTLTNELTNIPDSDTTTYYLPPAGKRGSTTSSSTLTSTSTATFDGNNESQAHVQYRAEGQGGDQSSSGTLAQSTGYYNFWAASLGYSGYQTGTSSGNTPRDICPKGWQLPRGSSTSTYSFYWLDTVAFGGSGSNRADATTRDKYLNQASFLYSGLYYSSQLYNVGSYGYWWSSTVAGTYYSYNLYLNYSGNVYPQYNSYSKYSGFAVRCVDQNSDVSGYMQDFDNGTLSTNQTATLIDKRDGNKYVVKKLTDEKVWMVQNLRLSNYNLTPDDSNVSSDFDITTSQLSQGNSSTWCTSGGSSCYNRKSVNAEYKNIGSFYNWYTATAGTNGSNYDICPKGWRLPTGGSSGEFVALDKAWGGTGTNRANANTYDTFTGDYANGDNGGFTLAGYIDGSLDHISTDGIWWSSAHYGSGAAYVMYLYSSASGVRPQHSSGAERGHSVRCIAKDSYTINYEANGGTGTMNPSRGYIDSATALSANTFAKEGYVFAGWSTDPNATTATYSNKEAVTNLTTVGGSVTLYAIWKEGASMQDFYCSSLSENEYTTLIDARDGNEYAVKKLKDDKCWMVQNLRLSNYNLTPDDSNVSSVFDITTFQLGQDGSSTWCTDSNSTCYNKKSVYARSDNNGSIYNWYTATAGTNSSDYDICPKNWRLPTGGPSGEFVALDKAWGGTGTNRSNASTYSVFTETYTASINGNFTLAGSISGSLGRLGSVGTVGCWWSSTPYSSSNAYSLDLVSGSSYVRPQDTGGKFYGYAVRCVAKN